jgi:hypothetical protein
MGYGSIYGREIYPAIEKGTVAGERTVDNTNKMKLPSPEEQSLEELEKLRQWEEERP